jgi:hypothetical protein
MKTKVYLGIALRLIILFSIGMLMAFVKPQLHSLLGDIYIGSKDSSEFVKDGYEWSAMHYWFFWMCFFLFILSLINCIWSIINLINKHYQSIF